MKKMTSTLLISSVLVIAATTSVSAGTLDTVKSKGHVQCGVSTGLAGFSNADETGNWQGLDVDVCRAVAAAVLGDASKVKFTPLTAKERFTALQSGEIDILSRNTTWTLTRDGSLGLNFAGVNYYDGQGFMVSKSLVVKSALDLDGAAVCLQSGTTTELNLADYFSANNMSYKSVNYDTSDATIKGFEAGRCDMLTSDQSQLYSLRIKLENPGSAIVLPEVISKEPLGPVVRQGDDDWFNVVRWSLFAMVNAEELGLTSANIDSMKTKSPAIERFVDGQGEKLGLDDTWAYNIIKQVGNYGESFEANVGLNTPLAIARGLNDLWSRGGIMYAPPIR